MNNNKDLTTADMEHALENETDIRKYIDAYSDAYEDRSLPDLFAELFEKYQVPKATVLRDSNLAKSTFYDVLAGRCKRRDDILAILLSIGCTEDECRRLLTRSGFPILDFKNQRDRIIKGCFKNGYNLASCDELLYDHGFETITKEL